MDILLTNRVISGCLNNETPNLITGMLQLAGLRQPLRLELHGNFMADIAGCSLEFVNPFPDSEPRLTTELKPDQHGHAGEMTASRRMKLFMRRHAPAQKTALTPPTDALKNVFFIEWFNEQHQRALIHASHWLVRVGSAQWKMTPHAETDQLRGIRDRRRQFLLARRRR